MPPNGIQSDRLKFGQYLIDNKMLDMQTLAQALKIQEDEHLTKHYRRLGIILWKNFGIFKDRTELYHYLVGFEKYRDEIEQVYRSLSYYSHLEKQDEISPEK